MEKVLPIACIILALALHYWVGRRRFNRRGIGGLQHFRSYERALFHSSWERVAKWLANLLLIIGTLLLIL